MKNNYLITLFVCLLTCLAGCQKGWEGSLGNPLSSDNSISASVEAALTNNNQLAEIPIHVETHRGNVELSGYVKTIRQSDTAEDLARKVNGVKTVQNNLIVRK